MINATTRKYNGTLTVNLCLEATIDDASLLSEYIEQLISDDIVSPKQRFRITVCIAEAVNNIVEHGEFTGNHRPIHCLLKRKTDSISVRLTDQAQAYTPPCKTDFDILEENGRGWHILYNYTDILKYHRNESYNQLYLHFNI